MKRLFVFTLPLIVSVGVFSFNAPAANAGTKHVKASHRKNSFWNFHFNFTDPAKIQWRNF